MIRPITVDFETHEIEPRPVYPPVPVSVAILEHGKKAEFWHWGHPNEHNCTKAQVKKRLRDVWKNPSGVLFHNAKFDLDVAQKHFALKLPPWHRIYDTLIEGFLYNPNMPVLSLKPLAENLLDEKPQERDRLKDWILENVRIDGKKIKPSEWGAYIAKAPANIVGPYCIGDVRRTKKLHEFFMKNMPTEGDWQAAYDRERKLFQVVIDMEAEGVPVDVDSLSKEIDRGNKALEKTDNWIRKRIKAPSDLNVGSRIALADALEEADLVDEWLMTEPSKTYPEGQRMVSIDGLKEVLKDPVLLSVFEYRSLLNNQLRTFAVPWFNMSSGTGKIYCQWNQVRQYGERKRGSVGARTGRLSSSPNFQNIPMELRAITSARRLSKAMRDAGVLQVPFHDNDCHLIDLRGHVVAPRGWRLFDEDYSQQELRILAHFCGGNLLEAYLANVDLDLHQYARELINQQLGSSYERKPIKNTGFGIIYGMGLDHLAEDIEADRETAAILRKTYKEIFPGMAALEKTLKRDKYCITWGGRYNPVEDPKFIKGAYRSFEYKLLNTLIQGSAADCTKEAMIRYDAEKDKHEGQLLISVHDELLGIARTKGAARAAGALRTAMESVEFDLHMKAEGQRGKSWRECH
jgi:DNA polymerase I-like protein with 3'-5' exonuclease and polymerase domains